MHLAVELVHEEVDVRTHVRLAFIGAADLDDATALRSREEQNSPLLLARLRAVFGDVHDLLGLAARARVRIVETRIVLLLVDLDGFRHDFCPPVRLGMCDQTDWPDYYAVFRLTY